MRFFGKIVYVLLLIKLENVVSLSSPNIRNRPTSLRKNTRTTKNTNNKKARIRASKTTIQKVKTGASNGNVAGSLTKYMQLPAAQYTCVPMPLDSSLSRCPNGAVDEFELIVPPIQLKSPGVPMVEVRPIISAFVTVESDRVVIKSNSCQIKGSKIIQDLKINEYFEFEVQICMTYTDNATTNKEGSIMAKSEIKVDLDPLPGVFGLLPKSVIELVGNRAIGITLEALKKEFMKNLGKDYERWSFDESYRKQRELQQLQMEQQQQQILQKNTNECIDDTLMAYLVNRN